MASIETRARKDGSYGYRVVWYDPDLPPAERKQTLTFDDPDEAKRCKDLLDQTGGRLKDAAKVMNAIRQPDTITVAEAVKRHIGDLTNVTDRTRRDYYRDHRLHVVPHWSHVPCTDEAWTRPLVKGWINMLKAEGLAPKTIANRHSLLSDAAKTARRDYKLITDNPCEGIALPEIDQAEMVFLEGWEFRVLYNHVPAAHRTFVKFLVGAGARWGEATALNVGDFALDARVPHVWITKAWKKAETGWFIGPPKTRKARRMLPLGEELTADMAELLDGLDADGLAFTGERGGRYYPGNFRDRVWTPAVDRATAKLNADGEKIAGGLRIDKRPRVHDLRHTNASWLIAEGEDIFNVSARLGHASTVTTTGRYGHLTMKQMLSGASAADRMLREALLPPLRLAS